MRPSLRSVIPAWRSPNTSPAPRISRSLSASTKPSVDCDHRLHARLAVRRGRIGEQEAPRRVARRGRRGRAAGAAASSPKRSASSTTITVAFGTSTPTSITVVATSTSSLAGAERGHHRLLLRRRHLAVQQPEAQAGELLGLQPLELLGRGAAPRACPSPRRAGTRRTPGGRPRPRRARARTPRTRSSGLGADDLGRRSACARPASRAARTCRGRRR